MAYVATRGGARAIDQSERLYRAEFGQIDASRVDTLRRALPMLIDRVMGEASLYEPDLAALALAQTGGDLYEAVLLLRAWRTTQPRLAIAAPVLQDDLITHRRISAAFKDIPGGQILGPTLDYSHRLLATDVLQGSPYTPTPVDPAAAPKGSPVEEEFFLYHTEPVEASGFCIHFKLPHYVTFQSALDALRGAKAEAQKVPA